ncbi:MAG: YqaA family protein [Gammaproteobacteria bacterium]
MADLHEFVNGLWALFASAFISSTVAPGGSEAVLAWLLGERHYAPSLLVAVATLGNTLGALTTWGLGYLTAKKYPAGTILQGGRQQAVARVKKWGGWALLFSWLPVIGDGLCFAGGWLKLPLLMSVLAITAGKAARYAAIAFLFV